MTMPMASIHAFLDRLPARMAEWKLMMVDPISLPHMKKSDRRSTLSRWEGEIRAAMPAQKPIPAKLRMMGIGVRFVGAEGGMQKAEDGG